MQVLGVVEAGGGVMSLRKEQGLLLATVAVIALLFAMGRGSQAGVGKATVRRATYRSQAVPGAVVTDALKGSVARARDLFLKPSLTSPLPPLDWPELPLPRFPDLPLIEPPLPLGPDIAHWYLRRVTPVAVTLAQDASEPSSSPASGNSGSGSNGGGGQDSLLPEELAETYDRVKLNGKDQWGYVLGSNKHARGRIVDGKPLALQGPFHRPLELRTINVKSGKVQMQRLPIDVDALAGVTEIEFANNVNNRIAIRRRHIPAGPPGLDARQRFVDDLLTLEREHAEALEEAEAQARKHVEIQPNSARGRELLARVYSETGRLEKEAALYDELAKGDFKQFAFVPRGRGVLAMRLGLFEDAERWLTEAVNRDRTDARNWLELSRCLSRLGRGEEALKAVREARALVAPGMPARRELAVKSWLVRTLLAVGKDVEAERALIEAKNVRTEDPAQSMLEGTVLYAKKSWESALEAFRTAAARVPTSAVALIGAGLCHFHLKQWNEAMAAFRGAATRDPLDRHLALCAQAFLLLQTEGRVSDAVARCEEAERMAPNDPFVLYLLGRAYRQSDRLGEARAKLETCLAEHHDFVEAMAEKAYAHLLEARQGAAQLLIDGERLAARTVQVDAARGKQPVYQDLLGVQRYHLRRNDAARRAFQASQQWGGDLHPKLWLALLRNRSGHVDDAITGLRNVWQFIRDEKAPFKVYSDGVMKMLQYHRGKRVFKDEFNGVNKQWLQVKKGQRRLVWNVNGGRLKVAGQASSDQDSYWRFSVEPGQDFVSASLRVGVGDNIHTNTSAVFRLSDQRPMGGGRMQTNFQLELGYSLGNSYLFLQDGRQPTQKNQVMKRGPELGADLRTGQSVLVGIEVDRGIDGTSAKPTLVVTWDGREILRRDCRSLNMRSKPLQLDLLIKNQNSARVDAWFDEFRLVRLGKG
jgi:tetratricopeptide (TPR) repeat protein